ncbi:MAG: YbjN domain-containing protein [Steroidobacteraceae bacterium]
MAAAQVGARIITPDARVEKLLKEAGLNYTIDEDGDYRLEFALDDDRSQLVWISSRTASYEVLEIRDVWSVAYRSKDPLSVEVANQVLRKNGEMILGAWQIKTWDDEYVLAYAAQVSANTDAASLESAAEAVVVSADELEKELTGKDEF